MRPIKFRAWDKNRSGYCHNCEVFDGGNFGDLALWILELEKIKGASWVYMQYTGMKDRNGKMIFEGDILQEQTINSTFLVVWDDKEARFNLVFQKGENGYKGQLRHIVDVREMKIIGNVFENPKLLER